MGLKREKGDRHMIDSEIAVHNFLMDRQFLGFGAKQGQMILECLNLECGKIKKLLEIVETMRDGVADL
jgi:hypothetical protein